MRTIGHIESEAAARKFSDFLVVQNIPNQIEGGADGRWDIWVHSDDDLPKAAQWLTAFRANPEDPQFNAAVKASEVRAEEEKELKDYQKKIRSRGQVFRRFTTYRVGPLTALLVGICVAVYVWSNTWHGFNIEGFLRGRTNLESVHLLLFSTQGDGNIFARILGSPEIRSGEIWRAVTPIFLHFGIIHIFFNMMWLRDLGGMIESVEGTAKLFAIILVSAALSNLAQYVVTGHPIFGGMSGVVYALLGYVWMKGKYHPGSGLYLHRDTVTLMLIWLVVCFTGALGPIANYAHLGGLIVGVVWGFMATRRV